VAREMRHYRLLHLTEEMSHTALAWFERFHLSHGVGVLDSLIGATAFTHYLILATLNTKHFASFPGLHIERPY
jgi:predicted nucleic acid-binding protein